MTTHKPALLLIKDERQIRRFVRSVLESEGWQVFEAESLRRARVEIGTRNPALLILDLGLPDGDGVRFIRELRDWSAMPVLVLSARAREQDKISALDAGADDYLVKPFGTGELLARVRAILRRLDKARAQEESKLEFGAVCVDLSLRRVLREGELLRLTPLEYRLLTFLIAHAGKVLTHQQLLTGVWGQARAENYPSLRVFMTRLRQKLEREPSRPQYLLTEIGVGYRFVTDPVDDAVPQA